MVYSRRPVDMPPLQVFAHTNAENAATYRAVLACFVAARERFALHLRPGELLAALRQDAVEISVDALDAHLGQLVRWGNLEAEADTAEVATIADFRRKRLLYRLSRAGEAAERALQYFEEQLRSPGELQSAGLDDVRQQLLELRTLLRKPELEEDKAHQALKSLRNFFDELTDNARRFMAGLMRATDLHGLGEEGLLHYKDRLIEYLEGFIHKLMVVGPEVAALANELDALGMQRALQVAARRETEDRLDASAEVEQALLQTWQARWQGLRGWFSDTPGHCVDPGAPRRGAESAELRRRAREAIPALLRAVANLHDRRVQRSDRRNDLLSMARHFAAAPSEADCERLFRAAFGLCSARHFSVDEDTLEAWDQAPQSPRRGFSEWPPLRIAPRMRATGSHTRRGRTRKVEDRSAARARLQAVAAAERAQLTAARVALTALGHCRLSAIGELPPDAFELLLDLLSEALSRQATPTSAVEATSADGSMLVRLRPITGAPPARIRTRDGTLVGPDCEVTFVDQSPSQSPTANTGPSEPSRSAISPGAEQAP